MADKSSGGDQTKGFGGFGDLVSDVSKDIESATRESSNPLTPKSEATVSSTSSTQHTTAQTEVPSANNPPLPPRLPGGRSGAKWFWGIGIVIVILIGISNSGKEKSKSHTPSPTYSTPSTYAPAATPITEPTTSSASVYSPALPKEDKPPLQKSDSQPNRHEEARSPASPSGKEVVNSPHKANFARCSDGRYSNLCVQTQVVDTENAEVNSAEHRARSNKKYP